jgi:hypothetical protein
MKCPDECDLGNISESQKLPNVFTGTRRTVTKLSSLLALSHVSSGMHVVSPKVLGHWDMFWPC